MKLPAWIKCTARVMVVVMGLCGLSPQVRGDMIPSHLVSVPVVDRAADIASIQLVLEHKAVKNRLAALGYTSSEIEKRLTRASNAEVHQLAVNMDQLTTGGDGAGLVISVLLIVLLVILILRLMDRHVVIA